MAYIRTAAVDFADKHWNIPADDGLFWLSNEAIVISQVRQQNVVPRPDWKKAPAADGWMPKFVDDGKGGEKAVFQRATPAGLEEILINPWEGIADCAHFLSRCLTAGGLKGTGSDERGVPTMIHHLQDRTDTKTLCETVPREAGQRIIDTGIFKPGDMIGYFNIDPKGDYDGKKEYAHSAMYAGKIGGKRDGGVTCHTICRFPGRSWVEDSWWLKPSGHYTYTLIHFTDDDPAPDAARAAALAGWWQLDYAGKTEYYLMKKTGSVEYSKRAPTKGQTVMHGAEGKAFWFMSPDGKITFTWRTTGTVEVWTPVGSGYTSMINGATPGALTKLP